MNTDEIIARLESTFAGICRKYNSGDINGAGKDIRIIFETIIYALKNAADIRVQDDRQENMYVTVIDGLYTRKLIDSSEKNRLHNLRKISNAFLHSAQTDSSGTPDQRAELEEYRRNIANIINFCQNDIEWVKAKFAEIEHKYGSSQNMSAAGGNDIEALMLQLRQHLDDLNTRYVNGETDSAGLVIRDIYETVLAALVKETGVTAADSDKGYNVGILKALSSQGWITRNEEDSLHHLRTTGNLFSHASKIEIEGSVDDREKLSDLRANMKYEVRLCSDIVKWIERKLKAIRKHGRHSANMLKSSKNISPLSRLNYVIPFLFAFIITLCAGHFLNAPKISEISQNFADKLLNDNLATVSLKSYIIFCGSILITFLLFSDITIPILAGCGMFFLARSATGSELCAALTSALMIIMTMRFPSRLRNLFTLAVNGLWFALFLGITPYVIKGHLNPDEPFDRYTIVTKIALPMIVYYVLFIGGRILYTNSGFPRPFENILDTVNIGASSGLIPLVPILAADAFLFRKTWVKGLILLTRDYYSSPQLFWTIHLVLLTMVIYIVCIKIFSYD
ncbi:MAG: hypothetical protein IKM72_11480 [Oscillospiraceae bacterium]|nr:hypothetical protein [Oscillospiraceae bacterium]